MDMRRACGIRNIEKQLFYRCENFKWNFLAEKHLFHRFKGCIRNKKNTENIYLIDTRSVCETSSTLKHLRNGCEECIQS